MQIAISTASLSLDTPTALKRAADLGFRSVEINLQPHEFGYGYRRKTNARFYRSLKKQIETAGLSVWSTTAPQLTQAQMFSNRARRDMMLSSAIAAGIVGSRVFSVQVPDIFLNESQTDDYFREGLAPPVIDGYDEAWVQAANRRVALAVRNNDDWIGTPLVNQPERMDKITRDLAIGWAMDLPLALKRAPVETWLSTVGSRIAVAYVYDSDDNDGRVASGNGQWLAPLNEMRSTLLKCVVMHGNPEQDDDAISAARLQLTAAMESA